MSIGPRKGFRPFYSENMSKKERVNIARDFGGIDYKRFELSFNPEVRARLEQLKVQYKILKSKYPEFVGLTVYGSHTKGYATSKSDFDGHVFVEIDQALASFDPKNLKDSDLVTFDEYKNIYNNLPKVFPKDTKQAYAISYSLNLKYERAASRALGENILGKKQMELVLIDEDYLRRCSVSDLSEDYASEIPISLFNLSLDPGIRRFREVVVRSFENQGDAGERKWNELMKQLGYVERLENGTEELIGPDANPARHEKIYPDLAHAREYFLI